MVDTEHAVLFSADEVAQTVREIAASIDQDFGSDPLVVLTVLKGAAIFSADLVRAMKPEAEMVYVTASSYSDGFTPGDSLSLGQASELAVEGRDVLIVDDIIDTGRTLRELVAVVRTQNPRSVSTVALISKTSRRSPEEEATYHGLEIGDEFIYGYGLDWDERYRDLPFIALANP
jgi:hypoxanthine phosphoribosyltransferase